jgi:hypothetical protein
MRWRLPVACLTVAVLSGCDDKWLVIESNTAWEGDVSYVGPVAGSGNAQVDLSDVPTDVCWILRKATSAGTLRAYLHDETWFGLGEEFDGDQTTTEPAGEIQGCNR